MWPFVKFHAGEECPSPVSAYLKKYSELFLSNHFFVSEIVTWAQLSPRAGSYVSLAGASFRTVAFWKGLRQSPCSLQLR